MITFVQETSQKQYAKSLKVDKKMILSPNCDTIWLNGGSKRYNDAIHSPSWILDD